MKFEKPRILKQIEYSEELTFMFDEIFFFLEDNIRYSSTPIDAIPFGKTGGDGCHFCFLTDFGLHKDLEKAPIIFVDPSEFECEEVKLIANNIGDFFGLLCYVKESEYLRSDPPSIESLRASILDHLKDLIDEGVDVPMMNVVFGNFLNENGISLITNPIEYRKKILDDRKSRIQLQTANGLGVVNIGGDEPLVLYDFNKNELSDIDDYLLSCSDLAKHSFYREFMYQFKRNKNWAKDFHLEEYLYNKYWKEI